jgi:hypothetical protein
VVSPAAEKSRNPLFCANRIVPRFGGGADLKHDGRTVGSLRPDAFGKDAIITDPDGNETARIRPGFGGQVISDGDRQTPVYETPDGPHICR